MLRSSQPWPRCASPVVRRWLARPFLAAVLLAATASGCDDKKSGVEAPAKPAAPPALSAIANNLDASVLGDPSDPPAPAGDLKEELDHFVNVDTCVAERAKLDPLVGDALGAIGYETFLRDACRLLEAARDKKRETCDRIDSSALRARCQTWVAIVSQTPDACPMQFEALVTRGRNPSCVAVAAKDARLCNGEARSVQRATCEAMVHRDPARCEALLPNQRALCQREVARWRSVLAPPLEGLEKLPTVRGKLVVRGTSGTPDPIAIETDLAPDLARGVVAVTTRDRTRIEIGTLVESEVARIAASPQKRSRIGLAVIAQNGEGRGIGGATASGPTVQKLELELPGEAPIVSPPSVCDCKLTSAKIASQRGGEAAVVLDGTVSSNGRTYKVSLDLVTFVRDVTLEAPGTRVLPPIHPTLRRDGGAEPR
jgi:hypothetical protein